MNQKQIDTLMAGYQDFCRWNTQSDDGLLMLVAYLHIAKTDFEVVLRVSGESGAAADVVIQPTCLIVLHASGKAVVLNQWNPLTNDEFATLGPYAETHWDRYVERIQETCGPKYAVTFREHLPWEYPAWARTSVRLSVFECRRVA